MFHNYFIKHLKEGEEIVAIVRRYYLTYAFQIFISAMLILIPFFLMYPLFRWGGWGALVFFLLLIFGLGNALRQTVIFFLNALVITRDRILDFDQKGMFERVVSESTYDKIQDVSFRIKGVIPTLFNYGDLEIQTAGTQANLEIKNIAQPQKIQNIIIRIQRESQTVLPKDLTAKELVELVTKIREGLGEEQFRKLTQGTNSQQKKRDR